MVRGQMTQDETKPVVQTEHFQIPLDHSLRLGEALPNAELHVFNHCDHWAQIEHAATFNWLVANFVLQGL